MKTSDPFPSPPPATLSYLYFGHVTFAVSDGRHVVMIDPFFSGEFKWKKHTERHLEPPTLRPEAIPRVDAVLVSHEHGDHWDTPSLHTLTSRHRCPVVAPRLTLDAMRGEGIETSDFVEAAAGQSLPIGDMTVTLFPSIESEGQPGPVQRVGFLIKAGGATLYHQGDSHGPAKAWQSFREELDALIIWPVYVDNYVRVLRPPRVIFHHMDRFEPGDFFCNYDAAREVDYWRYRFPETDFVAPPRNRWLPVRTTDR